MPVVAGLCIGLAVGARLPIGLALPLIMWMQRRDGGWWRAALGAAIPLLLIGAYNWARFDNPLEFGYGLIKNVQGESVLSEPWYTHGIDSIYYIPNGIYTMLFSGFEQRDHFPWMAANIDGVSILLTMPILLWVFEARGPLALVTLGTAILVMLPDLCPRQPGLRADRLPLHPRCAAIAVDAAGRSRSATAFRARHRWSLLLGIPINVWLSTFAWYLRSSRPTRNRRRDRGAPHRSGASTASTRYPVRLRIRPRDGATAVVPAMRAPIHLRDSGSPG